VCFVNVHRETLNLIEGGIKLRVGGWLVYHLLTLFSAGTGKTVAPCVTLNVSCVGFSVY
jgi:hypothetical protein